MISKMVYCGNLKNTKFPIDFESLICAHKWILKRDKESKKEEVRGR